ncbi:MAG TPA: hypothetical protein VM618_04055 [Acidimicrobiia bacterium]|nr:hypothetical protein [Acidimicrobiia bacterium]
MEPDDRPELQPLRVGEVIDVAFRIFRADFRTLVAAVAVAILPIAVVGSLTVLWLAGVVDDAGDAGDAALTIVAILVLTLASVAASQVGTAACLRVVAATYLGTEPDWRVSLRFAADRLRSLLWLVLLTALLLGLALLALVVPFVYFFVAWAVAVPVLLFEGTGGRAALSRSRELVRGRWWQTLATIAVAFILASVAWAVIGGVLAGLVEALAGDDSPVTTAGTFVVDVLGDLVVTPFTAVVTGVLYFDLRLRKEGFDADALARALDIPPEA